MGHDIPWTLLESVFSEKASESEKEKLAVWLAQAKENEMIFAQLAKFYTDNGSLPTQFTPDANNAFEKISRRIQIKPKVIRLYNPMWWKVAAIFVIVLLGWWLLSNRSVVKSIYYTSLSTTDSVQSYIVLSDGSKVWLNYGSKIEYPKHFGSKREVFLTGEAYFEITRDTLHPFIVNSGKSKIQVLGTAFNAYAYDTSLVQHVTVTHGKVSFGIENHDVVLLADDFGLYSKQNGTLVKMKNQNPNFLAWKTRNFYFENTSLSKALQDFAKVYRFNYTLSNPSIGSMQLTGQFLNQPLTEILETIAITYNLQIETINGQYVISNK